MPTVPPPPTRVFTALPRGRRRPAQPEPQEQARPEAQVDATKARRKAKRD